MSRSCLSRSFAMFPVFSGSFRFFLVPPPPRFAGAFVAIFHRTSSQVAKRQTTLGPPYRGRLGKPIREAKINYGKQARGGVGNPNFVAPPLAAVLQFPTSPALFVSIRVHPWLVNPQS